MSPARTTAEALVPHLKKCGYSDAQIARPFKVDQVTIPVAAFAGRPFDSWSACIAVVDRNGDSKASAAKVQTLGASTVFVCGSLGVDWWGMGPSGPTISREIAWSDVGKVFRDQRDDLAPSRIYDAKLQRPGGAASQLWFFDVGLMPAVEKNRGQMLLRLVVNAIGDLHKELGEKLNTRQAQEDVYRTVFWLLAAKVLHDKSVDNFIRIDLTNVDEVFDRIGKHHGETNRFPPFGKEGRRAIDDVAAMFAGCGSLADVSSESIAYVYENALIDKAAGGKNAKNGEKPYDIRKELGIHSTPSVLIHHMLSQLWGMIEGIKPEDRNVFEPACGHAPFLTGAMRWLRDWNQGGQFTTTHDYLRSHLHGLEADGFAIELAKLALTLADEPHGNSWQLTKSDMFLPGVLAKRAKKAHVLLSNPPYEAFTPAQRARYAKKGEAVIANTKATEMLLRTLPYLPPGGVFGVVLPIGVLHDKESKSVRESLLSGFDLSEISTFSDNLFEHGDHETAVLMGRRKKPRSKPIMLHCRRVRERGMAAFKERLAFSREDELEQSKLGHDEDASLYFPDLPEVWAHLDRYPRLGASFQVSKGYEFFKDEKLRSIGLLSKTPKPGWLPVALDASDGYTVWDLPIAGYLNFGPAAYRAKGGGPKPGVPQVVINHSGPRDAWRFRAVVDARGIAIGRAFLVVRASKGSSHSLLTLWAVLNSPVANGYAYSWSGKRHTLAKEWRAMPLPDPTIIQKAEIEAAAKAYLELATARRDEHVRRKSVSSRRRSQRRPSGHSGPSLFGSEEPQTGITSDESVIRAALLRLDAEVLKLYDLPPRLERQLLDLFTGVERKGVGCDFRGYYPPGFKSYLPLHMLFSDGFQRAAADATADRFKPGESAYVRDVLSVAAAGTGEE